jgi:hypothetical protein
MPSVFSNESCSSKAHHLTPPSASITYGSLANTHVVRLRTARLDGFTFTTTTKQAWASCPSYNVQSGANVVAKSHKNQRAHCRNQLSKILIHAFGDWIAIAEHQQHWLLPSGEKRPRLQHIFGNCHRREDWHQQRPDRQCSSDPHPPQHPSSISKCRFSAAQKSPI